MRAVTLADHAQARILTIDIETSPNLAYVWDLWRDKVGPAMLKDNGQVICWAAKWYGHKRVLFASDHHDGHDVMVAKARDLIDEADIVITYNGKRFDQKHLRREFLLADLAPPSPVKDVDLYEVVKQRFAFASNSLNHVSGRLEIGAKVKHAGFDLWRGCMADDPASWAKMKAYNVGDVRLTEDLYVRLLPWIGNHPHVAVAAGLELTCNRCGSTDLEREGDVTAVVMSYAMYRCQSCRGLVRASYPRRLARTRGI